MKKYFSVLLLVVLLAANACDKLFEIVLSGNNTTNTTSVNIQSIMVSPDYLSIAVGDTAQLSVIVEPDTVGNVYIFWSSSNAEVATVDNGLVTAVSEGEASIIASVGGKSAICSVVAKAKDYHEYVDLGLSVLWATTDMGADAPEEDADWYAWGEIIPMEFEWNYDWSYYKWCQGYSNNLLKYNTHNTNGVVVDNKTVLEAQDDAATVNWGHPWRIPTKEELEELFLECNQVVTSLNGVTGLRLCSKTNDNSIFLVAGREWWTSDLYFDNEENAYTDTEAYCGFVTTPYYIVGRGISHRQRCITLRIRPVRDREQE